jgi:hypothetical protein
VSDGALQHISSSTPDLHTTSAKQSKQPSVSPAPQGEAKNWVGEGVCGGEGALTLIQLHPSWIDLAINNVVDEWDHASIEWYVLSPWFCRAVATSPGQFHSHTY